ncbi:serine/threonine protein kinase [Cystobacter fuscus]
MVGDYRILEKLGSGGFGTVFKAERGGLFFAVKMLRANALDARARREISILLQLENPWVARFRACDRWVDPKLGTPYLVMDFVPGMTLEEFAKEENPSARESARILLETALTLGEVHVQGVFHRDLKPENILIKSKNERPVLIDFGVGTYAGAPVITPFGLPPGTYEFRSPEAYLFGRSNPGLVHYEFSASDELWALGVCFYWLLTNVLPFGDRNNWEGGGLAERIIRQRPLAPHVLNSRVPRALSDLCMKMLEKKPEDRYASCVELCAVLGGAMAAAGEDALWDLPLFDPDSPDTRTTEEEPSLVDEHEDEETRMLRKWARAQPRRGRKPKKGAEPAPNQDDAPTVAAAPDPDDALPVKAPEALAAARTRAFPHPAEEGLASSPESAEHGQESEAPRATAAPPTRRSRRRACFAAAAGLAVVVLGAILFATPPRSPPGGVGPLGASSEAVPTRQAESGREVARSTKPLDPPRGEGAEPTVGSISAPGMTMMLRKDDSGEKPPQKKTKVLGRAAKVIGTGLVCNALAGCTTPQQVRPTPESAPCPAGAVETMEALGLHNVLRHDASFLNATGEYIPVREGDTTIELLGDWGKLPHMTRLSGRLLFGDGRVYGRFTEAKVPGGGTFKVCLEMLDGQGRRGAGRKPDGRPESARIFSSVRVKAVESFE